MNPITEEQLELQAISWLESLGYEYQQGTDIADNEPAPGAAEYSSVVLEGRLRAAISRLNPGIPKDTLEAAQAQLTAPNIPGLLSCNHRVSNWLTKGIQVTFTKDKQSSGHQLKLLDFENPENNDCLVVNQFTVTGTTRTRRPDLVVFVNGLPLVVVELKNPASEAADLEQAYNQLQTYKTDIPDLFFYNLCLVISDGISARFGSLSANYERFMRWRTNDQGELDPLGQHRELETLLRGLLNKSVLLDYLRYCCLFETEGEVVKKIAGYHQYHAVHTALESVVAASQAGGTKQGGVVWHTQGAGKSLEMACLAGRLMSEPRLENPTILMLTDRLDLDGQLFGVFSNSVDLLGESPKQVESREQLRKMLKDIPSGGIIFTTIQKFGLEQGETQFPVLSERHNIVVIADEAHRTQYGFGAMFDSKTGKLKHGLARSVRNGLPNATFLAFTGTPISENDRDTRAVFGEYISIYDIQQAVEDGATVPIYYESRLAKLKLDYEVLPHLDDEVEDILESELADDAAKEKAKSQWAALEAIVGSDSRIAQVASDLIDHYETRSRTQPGKAMIVAMSREICVQLYDAIIKLRPDWHAAGHGQGAIKVVMTAAASDSPELQPHHTSKQQKKDIERRFKDPADELKIVIVRDMWLTGFDVPCLATMYIDKPMQGANLAQAIARVNRVFKDKPGGLVVDYIGIAPKLKEAIATYSAARGSDRGLPAVDSQEALNVLKEKIHSVRDMLHPVDLTGFEERALELMTECLDHILGLEDGKRRYCDLVLQITKAFALCCTLDEAKQLAEEVAFYQAIRAQLLKKTSSDGEGPARDHEFELQQLLSEAVVSAGVTDVFELAGLERPDLAVLSNEFLQDVRKLPQKNLAVELLRRLLEDEVRTKLKTNVVKQKKYSDMLIASLAKYNNRTIEAAQVIEELIAMAVEFKEDRENAKKLDLTPSEQAFYDALAQNDSAQELMGDELLMQIARELAETLRENLTIDWAVKESVRAKLRVMIRGMLNKYDYPPDQQDSAIDNVLRQAEVISEEQLASGAE